jgi:hypothetical protein
MNPKVVKYAQRYVEYIYFWQPFPLVQYLHIYMEFKKWGHELSVTVFDLASQVKYIRQFMIYDPSSVNPIFSLKH